MISENLINQKLLYHNLPIGYHSLNEDGIILDVNNVWLTSLGYTRDEVIGRWFGDFITKTNIEKFNTNLKEFFKFGSIKDNRLVLKHKNGKDIHVIIQGVIITKPDQSKATHCVFENITPIKESESKLKEQYRKNLELLEHVKEKNAVLKANDFRLKIALEAAGMAICEENLVTGIHYLSKEYYALRNLTTEDIKQNRKTFLEDCHPDHKNRISEFRKNIIAKVDLSHTIEYLCEIKPEGYKWISITGKISETDESGTPQKITYVLRDISERKEKEIRLKESEEQYRNLFELSPYPVIIHQAGKIVLANKAASIFIKAPNHKFLIGKPVIDYAHPEYREKAIARMMKLMSEGGFSDMIREKFITLDGEVRDVEVIASLIIYKGIKSIQVVFSDITEKLAQERNLIESEEKFRSFMESATNMMIITDNSNQITYCNKAFSKLMGMCCKKHPVNLSELFSPKEKEEKIAEIKAFVDGTDITKKIESTWISGTGKKYNGVLYLVAIRSRTGNIEGLRCIFQDLTERIKFERALVKARKKAELNEQLKSNFLANMSHEIRTPLNGIIGFTQMLKEPECDLESRNEYIDIIDRSGKHLLNVINDIMNISAIDSGHIAIYNERFNLNEEIRETIKYFRSTIDISKNSDLKIFGEYFLNDEDSFIISDLGKIQIVLNNLIRNAIKFTKNGFVSIGYTIENEVITFSVKDSGIGIPKSKITTIFKRFRQADDSHTRKFGGTGLGLAIAKGYLDRMKGKIWVESQVDQGSVFYFRIPYKKG